MTTVKNWQLGRDMDYPYDARVSVTAVRVRLQHQPLHRVPELHDGVQVDLDLQQGPGAHVVGERRDQAVRRLSEVVGREDPRKARGGQPRRPGLGRQAGRRPRRPVRHIRRPDHFRSGAAHADARQRARPRLPADRRGVERAEHLRGQPGRQARRQEQARRDRRAACRCTTPGSSIWPASATTARIRRAWRPARARRSTSVPRTASCCSIRRECRGYRKCVEACPYKKSMYRGNTRTSEKCIACYPRVEGTDPETGGEPMETRCMSACIGQIRMQGLVQGRRGRHVGRGSAEPALFPRARRQGGAAALSAVRHASRTATTSRRAGSRGRTCGRCSVRASTARSRTT